MPELTVEMWPLEKPTPFASNARVVPDSAIAKVAGSIAEFGFRQPIVVDGEGVIIAGHTRLLAAQRLGMAEVPVHVAEGLSDAQVKAYRLADNRTAQETSWDDELLAIALEELSGEDIDLALTGFDEDELAALLAEPTQGLTDPDEVPEVPEEPISKTGDLWLLGPHRLLCGDSTNPEDVQRLMDGQRAVLMATDPPYLVDYDGSNHLTTKGGIHAEPAGLATGWDKYHDHESSIDFYRDFLTTAREHALDREPGCLPVVCRHAAGHRVRRLACRRAPAAPADDLEEDARHPDALPVPLGLRAVHVRLDPRQQAEPEAASDGNGNMGDRQRHR